MDRLPEQLTQETVADVALDMDALVRGVGPLDLDLSQVRAIDSAGAALLSLLKRRAGQAGRQLRLHGMSAEIAQTLALFPALPDADPAPAPAPTHLDALGARSQALWAAWARYAMLCADTAWFSLETLLGRHRLRPAVIAYEMAAMGSRALGVVGLIAFLVGATMGLQSAAQLRQFGADIFVVDLIVVSMTRELGPLMAAIVIAGRSGASVAAELGTMTVTEEVDALRTMGLHPIRYLVVPKVLAISLVQPLLTLYANALGILGGLLVAMTWLDLGPTAFTARMAEVLEMKDVLVGLCKSLIFAWLIVTIGAWHGLATRGGADAVGRSTTSSVVAGIFAVVVADAVASLVFYF